MVRAEDPGTTPLVGRDDELALLDHAWAAATEGAGDVIVLVGDPAIGRSALAHELAHRVRGAVGGAPAVVVQVHGPPLPAFGLVDDVASALGGLLGDAEGPVSAIADQVEPLAASKLLGELLEQVDDAGPALVVVDDLHDADTASRTTLSLALRRLRPRHLLVLVTGRRTDDVRAFAEGFRLLALEPLALPASREVLRSSSTVPIADHVLERLLDHAGGNPLALTHLPRHLDPDQLRGDAPLPDPLPVLGELRDAFTRPLSWLGHASRELLELVAVSTDGDWAPLRAAMGAGAEQALQELESSGLGRLERGRVVLGHPLLRSAALAAMPDSRHRDLHLRLARVEVLPADRRVRHRAAATVGPDDALADELAEVAHAARVSGAVDVAASSFERAAELAGRPARRQELRLAAADSLALAGHPVPAATHLAAVEEHDDGSWRIETDLRRAWIDALHGDPVGGWQRLRECVPLAGGADRARVHAAMSVPLGMLGLVREIEAEAAAALEHAPEASAPWQVARVVHGHALVSLDESAGREGIAEVVATDLSAALAIDPLIPLHVGRSFAVAERYGDAESALARLRAHTRGGNARVSLAMAMGALGEVWVRMCRYDVALSALDEAIALSLATGQRAFAPFWLALRARVRAVRGDHDEAASDLASGFAIADELTLPGARYFLLSCAGLDALTRGENDSAIEHLEECRFFEDAGGVLSPNVSRWRADLVEAHCAAGDNDTARRVLGPLVDAATPGASRWTRATAARAEALVRSHEDPVGATEQLRVAAGLYDRSIDAFDRGRALLAGVAAARAAGSDPAELKELAIEARMVFRLLGAEPWEAKVDDAIAAPVATVDFAALTGAELAVLERLSEGATNAQIAASLEISPKTVANHLWMAYRKLGVSSRTEAVHRFLTR